MPANYDKTAWFYDALAQLVYGDALHKAQSYLLHHIPENASVLIIGGGTGKILEEITALHPQGLNVTYAELSANMITQSRKRNIGANKVAFINKAIEHVDMQVSFDVVITAFLFDNYNAKDLPPVFKHIDAQLKPSGIWLNTDFQLTGKWWQWLLLKGMYTFFKLFSTIDTSVQPDVGACFVKAVYQLMGEKEFYGRFVLTQAWRKGEE